MAQRLSDLVTWTKGSDTASWPAYGFGVINDSEANTKTGDDSIEIVGTLTDEPGFHNTRNLTFGNGSDGIYIALAMGLLSVQPGILNEATIRAKGDLTIDVDNDNGDGAGPSVVNLGSIVLSGGQGTLRLILQSPGLISLLNGGINGLDTVVKGKISGGSNSDTIAATGVIDNRTGSSISLYGGSDSIVAGGIYGQGDISLSTTAKDILTGNGADNIDLSLGYQEAGMGLKNACIDLGSDDDTITCFGTARLYGGKGVDTLLLPSGTYQVLTTKDKGCFLISDGTTTIYETGFEKIGSLDGTLSTFKIGSEIGLLTLA